jgi:peptide/nickel transport system permease protein
MMLSDRVKRSLKREMQSSFLAKVGLFFVVVVLFAAIFAPFIAQHNPTKQELENRNQPPVGFTSQTTTEELRMNGTETERVTVTAYNNGSWSHPLGTDPLGRDTFSRIIYGARTSLLVGIISTGMGAIFGTLIGLFAGYIGGRLDDFVMRAVDTTLALPGLILAIALIGTIGSLSVPIPDPWVALGLAPESMPAYFVLPGTVTFVIGLLAIDNFARIARGEALSVREEEYVKAAQSTGASDSHIVLRHLVPNTFTPILVFATIRIATAILLESTLSFLGFSGTTISWGFDIALGQDYLATSWWVAIVPGIAIVISVIGINLLGDWMRDALDPGLQSGGER